MPLIEIEDSELAKLQADLKDAGNWRSAWSKIWSGPNKMEAMELFKKQYPDVPLPELDTAKAASKPILDEMEKIRKEFADYREAQDKAQEERDKRTTELNVTRTIADAHARLKSQGWDDAGITAIEEEMQKRGVGDYDLVANWLKSQEPRPAPLNAAYEGRDLNWFNPGEDEPDTKLLMDNPNAFKSQMLKKFFSDRAAGNGKSWTS